MQVGKIEGQEDGSCPNQALVCANYIKWTSLIESAIVGGEEALKRANEVNNDFLARLSVLVLQESDPQVGLSYANFIVAQSYYAAILEVRSGRGESLHHCKYVRT